MTFTVDHVIYHAGCPDGYTAAWLLTTASTTPPVLHEGRYGQPPPDRLSGLVVIADFSYPPGTLAEIAARVDTLVVLDHHETAIRQIETHTGFPANCEFTLDPGRSGCGITADWLDTVAPASTSWRSRFVDYIEDRDLWRFNLPGSEQIAAVANATPMRPPGPDMFDDWATVAEQVNTDTAAAQAAGAIVQRRNLILIGQAIETVGFVEIGGHRDIPVVAVPYGLGSDAADVLCERYPDAPFTGYYIDSDIGRQFGLRAHTGSTVNVAKIAETYGGGGHPTASGFRVPWGFVPLAPGPRFGPHENVSG